MNFSESFNIYEPLSTEIQNCQNLYRCQLLVLSTKSIFANSFYEGNGNQMLCK